MAEVRRVRRDEWEQIKRIRLEMLEDSPEAFITTLPEAQAFDDSVWIERAAKGSEGSTQATMLGFDGDVPVAMAIGLRRSQGKQDVLVVVSVYVTPAHRGTHRWPRCGSQRRIRELERSTTASATDRPATALA